mmetsp:Transcript_29570/g.81274  ORF Transcript_29570/g.81274 Transcript_29570/m.81274 type:complete len:388 (-) Transcript_29570:94-1257(-)
MVATCPACDGSGKLLDEVCPLCDGMAVDAPPVAICHPTTNGTAAALQQAAQLLHRADALLICTGAGMGVDSGLGTFRGRNAGIWPPLRALCMDYSEMSDPRWFREDPRLAWAFWRAVHKAFTLGTPHAGYAILANWGQRMQHGLFSVTSNIDGHWVRTEGVGEELTFECHGAVTHVQLVGRRGLQKTPRRVNDAQIGALEVPEWDLAVGEEVEARLQDGSWLRGTVDERGGITAGGEAVTALAVRRPGGEDLCRIREACALPCDRAGRLLRPNVLMFCDRTVNSVRICRQEARYRKWLDSLPSDVRLAVVEVGAGTTIRTIRSIGECAAGKFRQSALIRINLDDSEVVENANFSSMVSIGGLGALDALSRIAMLLQDCCGGAQLGSP